MIQPRESWILPSFEERRVTLCQSFFDKIEEPNDKLVRMLSLVKDKGATFRSTCTILSIFAILRYDDKLTNLTQSRFKQFRN